MMIKLTFIPVLLLFKTNFIKHFLFLGTNSSDLLYTSIFLKKIFLSQTIRLYIKSYVLPSLSQNNFDNIGHFERKQLLYRQMLVNFGVGEDVRVGKLDCSAWAIT